MVRSAVVDHGGPPTWAAGQSPPRPRANRPRPDVSAMMSPLIESASDRRIEQRSHPGHLDDPSRGPPPAGPAHVEPQSTHCGRRRPTPAAAARLSVQASSTDWERVLHLARWRDTSSRSTVQAGSETGAGRRGGSSSRPRRSPARRSPSRPPVARRCVASRSATRTAGAGPSTSSTAPARSAESPPSRRVRVARSGESTTSAANPIALYAKRTVMARFPL